ncbi:hypothetical protein GCM10010171_43190 [Actinokineospora fastidiosa]|uniref:Uncharacterized protein n=1 Tax=Actinokineospora fastidiosa TaxID=1816 RepID=A0A918GLK1_9PSEU|nr:hypothetical protein GCM10010171_43190 [Actinokineospora fastidiosa]
MWRVRATGAEHTCGGVLVRAVWRVRATGAEHTCGGVLVRAVWRVPATGAERWCARRSAVVSGAARYSTPRHLTKQSTLPPPSPRPGRL